MKGFIALTSVLLISAVLLTLVVGASAPVFFARMNALETEWKMESQSLAKSCAEAAVLRRIAEPKYAGNDTLQIEDTPCTVSAVTDTGGVVRIDYRGAVTVLPF